MIKRWHDAILEVAPPGDGIAALAEDRVVRFDSGGGLLANIDAARARFPKYAVGSSLARALRELDAELARRKDEDIEREG